MANKFTSFLGSYGKALVNPIYGAKGALNVANRAKNVMGTTINPGTALKYILTPQTAYASESEVAPYGRDISGKPNPAPTGGQGGSQVPEWQRLGYPNETIYNQALSYGITGTYSDYVGWVKSQMNPQQTSSTGGGVATEEPARWTPKQFLGTTYNTESDYYNARRAYVDSINREKLSALDKAIQDAIGGRNVDINSAGGELGRQRSSLLDMVNKSMQNYDKSEQSALGNLSNYYSNLGEITQSSQGVRENETRGEYTTARSDLEKQKTEQMSSLDRALQNYLYQDTQNRNALALGYTQDIDQLVNQVSDSLVSNQNIDPARLSYSAPTINAKATGDNSALINSLNSMRSAPAIQRFGINPGKTDTNAILNYLYGMGA